MAPFTFNTSASVVFGEGAVSRLGALAAERMGLKIMIVTDPGIMQNGLLVTALASLKEAGIAVTVFDGVIADPPEDVVKSACALAVEMGVDGIVGMGGGSSLDVAKLVALLARSGETLPEVYGVAKAKGPRLPLMLVPTTAGTGSEVTPIAIVTTGSSEKMGVVSPWLIPDIALLDPELTLALPPAITAATGIDAMVHAIEAYSSVNANNNPLSRMLARQALQLMGRSLERAVHHGHDRAARGNMLLGSMLAGQAFANSPVAAVHALAYPIGGHFHVPHGLSNALVLPHVLAFNAPVASAVYAEIAVDLFPQLESLGSQARAGAFIDEIAALSQRCGLPQRLRDVGIPQSALEMMARDAMNQTRLLVNNPRPLGEADAMAVYEAAW
ncbi:MAG: iron-containing alcohol dehydrogenase [Hyphomicrobiales bacterium]|nr:iron-containing alcohol dehydrogenase [Hyphomicrobiales bacterium]MDE2113311.1 iron-containing alcohol dehydrogenase [Hyphomicrobiales bacterium]